MIIRKPRDGDIPRLRAIWQQAFGDPPQSIAAFFNTAFSPERSRVAEMQQVLGGVYWFDLSWLSQRYALLYALAVEKEARGRGVGSALLRKLCRELKEMGYAGAILVPGSQSLYNYYEKLGFQSFGKAQWIQAQGGIEPIRLQLVRSREYLQGREGFAWDGQFAGYLESLCLLYRAEDIWVIRYRDFADIQEYIGPMEKLPGVLAALGMESARVRMPGAEAPAGMCCLFKENMVLPDYFGPMLD